MKVALLLFQVSLVEATMWNTSKYWLLPDFSLHVHDINIEIYVQLSLEFICSVSAKLAFNCSNTTVETSKQGLKHARSSNENARAMSITSFWCVEPTFHIILIWCFHYWFWTIKCLLRVWKPASWIKYHILVHFVYWESAFAPYSIGERYSPYMETSELISGARKFVNWLI